MEKHVGFSGHSVTGVVMICVRNVLICEMNRFLFQDIQRKFRSWWYLCHIHVFTTSLQYLWLADFPVVVSVITDQKSLIELPGMLSFETVSLPILRSDSPQKDVSMWRAASICPREVGHRGGKGKGGSCNKHVATLLLSLRRIKIFFNYD